MSTTRLVNVRLDQERLRKARALREKGIVLSDLVRAAIDARYEQAIASHRPLDAKAIFARLDAEFPITAAELPPRKYNVHDRQQAGAAIRKRLERRRKGGGR